MTGSAAAVTSGDSLIAAPLPTKSMKFRFIRPPSPPRKTTKSSCVPSGGFGSASSTSVQFCQPPVGAIVAVSATSGPSGASSRSWIVPPAPPEATRKETPADPLEVERRVGDVVAVLDEADVEPAALRVGGGLRLHAGVAAGGRARHAAGGAEELGLLVLGLEDGLVATGQGAGPAAAVVGVDRLEHREDVRLVPVARGALELEGALATRLLIELVGVLVVTERDVQRDFGTVDRAVLGVGDRDLVGDGVAEGGDLPVLGELDRDLGTRVAHRDRHVVDTGGPRLVGHAQGRGVVAGDGVLEGRVGLGGVGRPVAVEVPGVRQRRAVGVVRALARELDGERGRPGVRRRGGLGDRPPALPDVVDPVDARVEVVAAEARAPLDHVQRAVGPELDVHRPQVARLEVERADTAGAAVVVQRRGLDPALVPLADEPLAVVELGELGRARVGRVVVVARAAGRRAAGAEVREARVTLGVAVPGAWPAERAAGWSGPCCWASC